MTPEQMQKIVDDAPETATTVRISKCGKQFLYGRCDNSVCGNVFLLSDLRTALAKHDTLDLEPADIPHGCIVLEK